MNPVEIIKHKRNRNILSHDEIEYFINGYLKGDVTEYQMSAFLMAVYFNGMNDDETFYLTEIMLNSGVVIDHPELSSAKITSRLNSLLQGSLFRRKLSSLLA